MMMMIICLANCFIGGDEGGHDILIQATDINAIIQK